MRGLKQAVHSDPVVRVRAGRSSIRRFVDRALPALGITAAGLFATPATAAPLKTLTLEGQLLTVAGSPVPDGDYIVRVSFYADKGAAKAEFSELTTVKLEKGGFVVTLGLSQALPAEALTGGTAGWIGIQVGSDPELPRLPISHVAYAFRAENAAALSCTGCIETSHLASSVLEAYAKKTELAFAKADQKCQDGEAVAGVDADGKVQCVPAKTYSGADFATADQACKVGELVSGIGKDGAVVCAADTDTTYSGKDFAVSSQKCGDGFLVSGLDADGKVVCTKDADTTYTGTDFAKSGQSCQAGMVVSAIDKDGVVTCQTVKVYTGGDFVVSDQKCDPTFVVAGVTAQGKLVCAKDGGATYDGKDFAVSNQKCDPGQVVTGVDAAGKVTCAADKDTVKTYDGKDFAVSNQKCDPGQVVTGVDAAGKVTCAADKDTVKIYDGSTFATSSQACGAGQVVIGINGSGKVTCAADKDTDTKYTAGTGLSLSGTAFALNTSYTDGRYVNAGAVGSVTGAMVKDGDLTGADLKNGSVTAASIANETLTGTQIKNGSISAADIANSTITGTQIKNLSVTAADIANETLTGTQIKNGSLTASDIASETITTTQVKNGSLTAADIANETITGTQIKNGSISASDIASSTITGTQIKNGSIGYADVATSQIQRRVTGTCGAGFAITAIAENGTVSCESSDYAGKVSASVANGNWYRIGSLPAGDSASGVFTLVDKSYRSQARIRVSMSRGYDATSNVELLSHPREGTLVFEKIRILENSASTAMYVDVKVKANASADAFLSPEPHIEGWKLEGLTLLGTSDTVSGYNARIFDLDNTKVVGDNVPRLTIDRNGHTKLGGNLSGSAASDAVRIQTKSGYVDIGPQNTDWVHFGTDRAKFYFAKRIHVDEGVVSSYDEDLYLQTAGTTRIRISNSNGNVGIGTNPSSSYKLYVNGAAYTNGAHYVKGAVTATNASRFDGGIGIGVNASSSYKLYVNGNVRASNYYVGSSTLESYIVSVVNNRCRLYVGHSDNNASSYYRYAYMTGDAESSGYNNGSGGGGYGVYASSWAWVKLSGDVGGDDRIFFKFVCSTSY
ncbi:MAG: hypothetical protein H6747_10545 [Deltaproteobacteria bacterium]|nr:hypothetical protein [Deltaproteobacteria bacterium]